MLSMWENLCVRSHATNKCFQTFSFVHELRLAGSKLARRGWSDVTNLLLRPKNEASVEVDKNENLVFSILGLTAEGHVRERMFIPAHRCYLVEPPVVVLQNCKKKMQKGVAVELILPT